MPLEKLAPSHFRTGRSNEGRYLEKAMNKFNTFRFNMIYDALVAFADHMATETEDVSFEANGVVIVGHPGESLETLQARYNAAYDVKFPPLTPEQEAERKRESEARQIAYDAECLRKLHRMLEIVEPLTFDVKPGAEEKWSSLTAQYKSLRGDTSRESRYGRRIYEYASDWALLMQSGMSSEEAERLADHDGISGNIHLQAKGILRACWAHEKTLPERF